jgi:hypothetical protein
MNGSIYPEKMDEASRLLFNQLFVRCDMVEETGVLSGKNIHISPVWRGVDRPNTGGWGLPMHERKLAERLQRAITSGDAFCEVTLKTDIYGKTYVGAVSALYSKELESDLRKLGY